MFMLLNCRSPSVAESLQRHYVHNTRRQTNAYFCKREHDLFQNAKNGKLNIFLSLRMPRTKKGSFLIWLLFKSTELMSLLVRLDTSQFRLTKSVCIRRTHSYVRGYSSHFVEDPRYSILVGVYRFFSNAIARYRSGNAFDTLFNLLLFFAWIAGMRAYFQTDDIALAVCVFNMRERARSSHMRT